MKVKVIVFFTIFLFFNHVYSMHDERTPYEKIEIQLKLLETRIDESTRKQQKVIIDLEALIKERKALANWIKEKDQQD